MSKENKETTPVPTEAELTAAGPVAQSPEEAEKMLREDKAKTKKAKAKVETAPDASALRAVGVEACKRHQLTQAWVTSDGQVFPQEGDAREHARNLGDKTTLKVTAK